MITIHRKITEVLRFIRLPRTATVMVRFFQDTGIRLWNWMMLRMWSRRVTVKKKHQVNMQKILKVAW